MLIFAVLVRKESLKRRKLVSNAKKEMMEWVIAILIGILVVMLCRMYIATNYEVIGKSMMPTLEDHDRVIVTRLSNIDRMDIVIFKNPNTEAYVKRVIGLPGDSIKYENDELYINNKKVAESFLSSNLAYQHPEENFTEDFELEALTGQKTVPADKLFVLGDNRISSLDSRYFHFIDEQDVIGEVTARYWPLPDATIKLVTE